MPRLCVPPRRCKGAEPDQSEQAMTHFSFSMQRKQWSARRAVIAGLLGGAAFLAACSEPEVVLPGQREDIRSVLSDGGVDQSGPVAFAGNQTRAISLPATRVNADWTQTTGTPATRVNHPALAAAPTLRWVADIGNGDSRKFRITAAPVVSQGRIFTLDSQSVITATSTAGATLWQADLRPPRDKEGDATGGGVVVFGDTVYAATGFGVLTALDATTGAVRWTQQLGGSSTGAPAVSGDLIYVLAGDNTGFAINRYDGTVAWELNTSESLGNVLGAPAPAVTDEFAVFAFGSGEVQGVFRRGGLSRWDTSVVGKRAGRALSNTSDITAPPVVSGNTVYVGNQSGRIAALELDSGSRIWTAREGAVGPVWPAGDSVFAVSELNELMRLDASDGSKIWGVELPNFIKRKPRRQGAVLTHHGPIVAGGRVIIASSDGLLRSYDPTNGALLASTELPGGATSDPVVAGQTLYVVNANGELLAYR